jgi:hypothetical protein
MSFSKVRVPLDSSLVITRVCPRITIFFFCNLVLDSSADLLDCVDDRCMFTCCLLPF